MYEYHIKKLIKTHFPELIIKYEIINYYEKFITDLYNIIISRNDIINVSIINNNLKLIESDLIRYAKSHGIRSVLNFKKSNKDKRYSNSTKSNLILPVRIFEEKIKERCNITSRNVAIYFTGVIEYIIIQQLELLYGGKYINIQDIRQINESNNDFSIISKIIYEKIEVNEIINNIDLLMI